jgi:hypothetical protein
MAAAYLTGEPLSPQVFESTAGQTPPRLQQVFISTADAIIARTTCKFHDRSGQIKPNTSFSAVMQLSLCATAPPPTREKRGWHKRPRSLSGTPEPRCAALTGRFLFSGSDAPRRNQNHTCIRQHTATSTRARARSSDPTEAHRIHTDRLTIVLAAMAHERRTATASIAAKYPSGTD